MGEIGFGRERWIENENRQYRPRHVWRDRRIGGPGAGGRCDFAQGRGLPFILTNLHYTSSISRISTRCRPPSNIPTPCHPRPPHEHPEPESRLGGCPAQPRTPQRGSRCGKGVSQLCLPPPPDVRGSVGSISRCHIARGQGSNQQQARSPAILLLVIHHVDDNNIDNDSYDKTSRKVSRRLCEQGKDGERQRRMPEGL